MPTLGPSFKADFEVTLTIEKAADDLKVVIRQDTRRGKAFTDKMCNHLAQKICRGRDALFLVSAQGKITGILVHNSVVA